MTQKFLVPTGTEVGKTTGNREATEKGSRKERKEVQRGGWTLISVMATFLVIAMVIGGIIFTLKRAKRSAEVDTVVKKVTVVLSTLDTISNLSGYYPAKSSAVDISTTDPFKRFLGTNVNDVKSVTYKCAVGTASTYTVTFPPSFFGSGSTPVDICNAVAFTIKQQRRDLTSVTCDTTGKLTITKSPVNCQTTY